MVAHRCQSKKIKIKIKKNKINKIKNKNKKIEKMKKIFTKKSHKIIMAHECQI